jgi:hypothetical protein
MRNILLLTVLIVVLASCATPSARIFTFDKPIFKNADEANTWVYNNIRYCWDKLDNWDKLHHWQSPQETLDKSTGVCIDMAILFASIMKYQKGYDSYILVVYIDENTSHAIVECNSRIYDPDRKSVV